MISLDKDRVYRRMAALFFRMLPTAQRASLLDMLVNEMVSDVPLGDKTARLYTPFPGLLYRASNVLTKEIETVDWIKSFDLHDVLWDIGANVGIYSVYAALCRGVSVLAFEPSAANFYALVRNIQLNELSERISALCMAFAGATTLGDINLSSVAMGAAVNQFGRYGDVSPYAPPETKVSSHGMLGFTIDEFISLFQPKFPQHIKLDVDGLEKDILDGAEITLADRRLKSILVELNVTSMTDTERVISFLNCAGFSLVLRGGTQGGGLQQGANHIFKRSARTEGQGHEV